MARRTSPTPATDTPAADPLAILAALGIDAASLATALGVTPTETPATDTGVQAVPTDTPEGQPVLRNPGAPASLKQKRLYADLRYKALAKPTAAQTKARTVYEQALNAYLVALGVKGAASLTMSDAQAAIAELRA